MACGICYACLKILVVAATVLIQGFVVLQFIVSNDVNIAGILLQEIFSNQVLLFCKNMSAPYD